jgi:hypothetical protein
MLLSEQLATFVPSHPVAAFAVGFASHFVLDAIPHIDYPVRSFSVDPKFGAPMAFDRALLQDVVTIDSDDLFGCWPPSFYSAPSRIFGRLSWARSERCFLVPVQFACSRFPYEPPRTPQRFHLWAHSKKRMDSIVLKIGTQTAFVASVVGLTAAVHRGIFGSAIGDGSRRWLMRGLNRLGGQRKATVLQLVASQFLDIGPEIRRAGTAAKPRAFLRLIRLEGGQVAQPVAFLREFPSSRRKPQSIWTNCPLRRNLAVLRVRWCSRPTTGSSR